MNAHDRLRRLLSVKHSNAIEMMLDPELAQEFLLASPMNRDINKTKYVQFCQTMRRGEWVTGDSAFVFNKKGEFRNGHTRASAVVATGVTIPILLRCNVDESEVPYMDRGTARNPRATMLYDKEFCEENPLVTHLVLTAVLYVHTSGVPNSKASYEDKKQMYLDIKDSTDFVIGTIGKRKAHKVTTNQAVIAGLIRAVEFGCDKRKMEYAINWLSSGGHNVNSGEVPLEKGTASLGKFVKYLSERHGSGSGVAVKDAYLRTEKAIQLFLKGRDVEAFVVPKVEQFPIPYLSMPEVEPDIVQHEILGKNLFEKIKEWATDQGDGTFVGVKSITTELCGGLQNVLATSTIRNRMKNACQKHSRITINGIGYLEPVTAGHGDVQRVEGYTFHQE